MPAHGHDHAGIALAMRCYNCGQDHSDPPQKCPLIKSYSYYSTGELMRVEFVTIADMHGGFELVSADDMIPPGTTVQ